MLCFKKTDNEGRKKLGRGVDVKNNIYILPFSKKIFQV